MCNKEEDIKIAFAAGATGVMTDYPTLLSNYIKRHRQDTWSNTNTQSTSPLSSQTHTVQMLLGFKHTATFYTNGIINSTGIVFTWNLIYGILRGPFREYEHIRINRTHILQVYLFSLLPALLPHHVHSLFIMVFSQSASELSASPPMFANKHYPTSLIGRAKSISCAPQGTSRQQILTFTLSFWKSLGTKLHDLLVKRLLWYRTTAAFMIHLSVFKTSAWLNCHTNNQRTPNKEAIRRNTRALLFLLAEKLTQP